MKYIFVIFLLIISFSINAQSLNKNDLKGKWYQCEESDGKVIDLHRFKCSIDSLNEEKTSLIQNNYNGLEWDLNLIGTCSITNHFNEGRNKKINWRLKDNKIKLDSTIYIVVNEQYNWFDKQLLYISLVREDYFEMYKLINSQVNQLRQLLNTDWMIVPIDSGFSVYYNRGQNVEFESHFNTSKSFYSKKMNLPRDSIKFNPKLKDSSRRTTPDFYYTENDISPDSIYWDCYTGYMYRVVPPTNEELRKEHPKNGVLKIDIRFGSKWSKTKFEQIAARNNALKKNILTKNLYKSNESIFHDYRYWLPTKQWQDRTKKYDYYFERLPYESITNNYSIFINPNIPSFFCEPLYVDDSDSLYFSREKNKLEEERRRTLKIIALSLGIQDFEIVDSHSAFIK